MPFTPPSGQLNPPPMIPVSGRNWASFRKRLWLLPLWFLLGIIPVGMALGFVGTILQNSSGNFGVGLGFWLGGGAMALFVAWGIFKFLAAPLALERRQELRWALLGVPLILICWLAFLAAVVFALCSGFWFR
jgi:ABC-type Fe3+-siderophore transport system permease subunit